MRCFVISVLLSLAACEEEGLVDSSLGVAEYEETDGGVYPDGGFGEVEPVYGMYDRQRVEAYDFGPVEVDAQGKPPVNPMYVLYDESGSPLLELSEDQEKLEGQGAIVETLLDRPDYSPFWEIVQVTAPAGYQNEDIKSLETLERAGFEMNETGVVVNCPMVEEAAVLARGLSERARPLPRLPLWFRRLKAFCFLVDRGWEVLQDPKGGLGLPLDLAARDVVYPVLDLFGEHVVAKDNRLFGALPGDPEYSPLVRVLETPIDDEFAYGDIDAFADAVDPTPREPSEVRNVPIRGVIPACGTNVDCESTATASDAPLTCNLDLRIRAPLDPALPAFCDAPPVGFGEECGPGIARCDPFGGPAPPDDAAGQLADLICVGLRAREKRFCYNACDPDEDDTNEDEKRDSRCGGVRDFQCYGLRRAKKPDGVCFKRCNSLATNRLVQQCANVTADTQPAPAAEDILCGNGAFDVGETCDPTAEPWDGATCNEICSISTLAEDPPVQAPEDDHPLECTNAGVDICIFPDERAEEVLP
ncbi:MAG: hypothetical protein HYY06_01255 [Deltaproteobacteria bacterium]|nr:hypothetical protein [Deltaproteobacteria bacterium]